MATANTSSGSPTDRLLLTLEGRNADGSPRFTPQQVADALAQLALIAMTQTSSSPPSPAVSAVVAGFASRLQVPPNATRDEVGGAFSAYFARSPLPPELREAMQRILTVEPGAASPALDFDRIARVFGQYNQRALSPVDPRGIWGSAVAVKEVEPPEASPRAPWEALDEPPDSPRWSSGLGVALMSLWLPFWRSLAPEQRDRYLAAHPAPEGWDGWLQTQGGPQ